MDTQAVKQRVDAERRRRRKRGRKKWLVLLLLLLLVAGLVGLFLWKPWQQNTGPPGILAGNYNEGALDFTDGELEAYLQRIADEDQVTIQLNTMPYFYQGGLNGDLLIQNTAYNDYHMLVEIHLGADDSGALVYSSGFIPPGAYVDYADLTTSLTVGQHAAIAYISFWEGERHVTTASADMVLVIQS